MATGKTSNHHPLHFVLVPWLGQGHMIPMVDIARLLAADLGVTITIITTPVNAARIQPTIDRITASGLPIRFVPLRFPATEAGLPEGCENIDSLPSRALTSNFYAAAKLMKEPLLHHLRHHQPPTCMITDFGHPWTHHVALELGVPRYIFHGCSCFSLLSIYNLNQFKTHESVTEDSESFVLPGLPHRIEITRPQLPRRFHLTVQYPDIFKDLLEGEERSDGYVVNSFHGLEPGYAESLEMATGKKVWMIGPVSLYNQGKLDLLQRGNKAAVDERRCSGWLDSKEPGSVIYVSFGSMGSFGPSQFMELGMGLLGSGRPFVWVVKEGLTFSPEIERWLSENFDESRCLLIRGWAPQVVILTHPAVGVFLTHCGWNSSLESACAGVPMLTWPMFAEQFLNEKLIVEVLRTGVSLGVMKPTEWVGGEEGDKVVVAREEIASAVRRLMDEEEEGKDRRKRARKLKDEAKKALKEGGSSCLNLSLLVQYVTNQCGQGAIEEARENGLCPA